MSKRSSGRGRPAGPKGDETRRTSPEAGDKIRSQEAAQGQVGEEQAPAPAPEEEQISPQELAEVKKKAAERDEIYERLLRLAADFDNRRKRLERDAEARVRYAVQDLLTDVLPVFDDLSRAINAARSPSKKDAILEGIELVEKHLYDALAKHGVRPIPAVGQPFDPQLHEAVSVVATDEYPESTVVEEVQRGWLLNDRVVRASKVLVSTKPPQVEEEDEDQETNQQGGEEDQVEE